MEYAIGLRKASAFQVESVEIFLNGRAELRGGDDVVTTRRWAYGLDEDAVERSESM